MTKTPTLDSFTTPEPEPLRFTPAHDVSGEFYKTLHDECDRLSRALTAELPVKSTKNGHIIQFGDATAEQFEAAMARDPKPVIQGLAFACHLTERMIREHLNIDNFFRYASPGASIRGEEAIQNFIERGCFEFLPAEMPMETVAFLYFRKMEHDRLQYARGEYFSEVHTSLQQAGFAVMKDESLPGRPNLVINREEPIELTENAVAGKALKAKSNDLSKRARHGASCCGSIKDEVPGVTCVLVFKMTRMPFPNDRVREKLRERTLSQNRDAIDRVFFSDEIDDLVEFCEENITYLSQNDDPGSRNESHEALDGW